MKALVTIIFSLFVSSYIFAFGPSADASNFYICQFNDTVTTSDIIQLQNQGFEIVKKVNPNTKTLYLKAPNTPLVSKELQSKIKELVRVAPNGRRIYIIQPIENDPVDFISIFFNFL